MPRQHRKLGFKREFRLALVGSGKRRAPAQGRRREREQDDNESARLTRATMTRPQRVASVGSDSSDGSFGLQLRRKRDLARVRPNSICAGVET